MLGAHWVVALCEEGVDGEQVLLVCIHPAAPGISAPGLCGPSYPQHFYSSDDLPAERFSLGFLGQVHPLCPGSSSMHPTRPSLSTERTLQDGR